MIEVTIKNEMGYSIGLVDNYNKDNLDEWAERVPVNIQVKLTLEEIEELSRLGKDARFESIAELVEFYLMSLCGFYTDSYDNENALEYLSNCKPLSTY